MRIKNTLRRIFNSGDVTEAFFDAPSGFKLIGDNQWLGWWSNNFEDKDKEIFSAQAIDNYVTMVKTGTVPAPELWFMHLPGSRHGVADRVFRIGHFALAIGHFEDAAVNPLVTPLRKWYEQATPTMSHGYDYPRDKLRDGVYHEFVTFELSTIRPGREANPFTSFQELKRMLINEEDREFIEEVLGEETAAELIETAKTRGDKLEAIGTRYKAKAEAEAEADVEAEADTEVDADAEVEPPVKTDKPRDGEDDDDDYKALVKDVRALLKRMDEYMKRGEHERKTIDDTLLARVERLQAENAELRTKMDRVSDSVLRLVRGASRASRADETRLSDSDPHAQYLINENEKGQRRKSVIEQMLEGQRIPLGEDNS